MKKSTAIRSLPGFCLAAILVLGCTRAKASVLWDGDASHGTGVFSSLNIENNPGQVNVVNDSTYGQVFQFICFNPTTNIKTRTEGSHMAGFQPVAGGTYYFGWRHKWGPYPTLCGKWQVVEQIHLAGTGATGGPVPFGLHVDGCDPNMHFQYQDGSGTPHDFLVLPFPLNSWHTFTFYEKWSESESDGFVEFWYDGIHKILSNGSYRYPAAWCFPNSTSYWKWGIYRSGSGSMIGTAYAYLGQAKAGTTYADVNLAPTSATLDTTGIYQIQNVASGLVLNNQGSLTNGSKITQWSSASTSDNLRWHFSNSRTSSGYYEIISQKSGLDAVVQSASTAAGAGIVQWSFGSSGDDQWQATQNSDGSYTFHNLKSGLVLGDPGSSTSTSTQMDQETPNGGSNQKWNLLKQ
ncbi:MAG TPA: RICIN domain-containing protein [Desulfuromonadaceae bacterium]|nr:RICIN domain-containing protein [Desulfuromonadaceae bacterium]